MTEIPGDFAFRQGATLESLEEGIRAVVSDQKTYMALLAVAFGRIKEERLYLRVAISFKAYCRLDRVGVPYRQSQALANAGSRYMEFRSEFQENEIRFSEHISKTALIDPNIARADPLFWKRFPGMTVESLKKFNRTHRPGINVYPAKKGHDGTIIAKGARLSIDGHIARGINLNEVRRNVLSGKRAVIFWADDDSEARKIRRSINI